MTAWQGINLSNNGFSLTSGATNPTTLVKATCDTPPVVSINPTSASVKPGQSVTFNSAATGGTPTPSFLRWEVFAAGGSGWATINGATTPSLTFTAHKPLNGNQYRAWYRNTAGDTPSSSATLTVAAYGDPVSFKLTPPAPDAKPGEATLFTVTEYDIDGNELPNATHDATFTYPADLTCNDPVPVGADLSCSSIKTGSYLITASVAGSSPTSLGDDKSTLKGEQWCGRCNVPLILTRGRRRSADRHDQGFTDQPGRRRASGSLGIEYSNLVPGVLVGITYAGGDPTATLSMGGLPCPLNTCHAPSGTSGADFGIAIFADLSIDTDSSNLYRLVADAAGAASGTQYNPSDPFTVWQQSLSNRDEITGSGGETNVVVTLLCDSPPCAKNVSVNVNNSGGQIEVLSNGTGGATFVVHSNNWAPEPAVNPVPATRVSPITATNLGTEDEVWCLGTFEPSDPSGLYGATMPPGHTWCLIKQITHIQGTVTIQVNIGTVDEPIIVDQEVQAMVVEEYSLLTGDAGACRKGCL